MTGAKKQSKIAKRKKREKTLCVRGIAWEDVRIHEYRCTYSSYKAQGELNLLSQYSSSFLQLLTLWTITIPNVWQEALLFSFHQSHVYY